MMTRKRSARAKTADSFHAIIFRSEKDRAEVPLTVSGERFWTGKFDIRLTMTTIGYWDDKNQVWVSNDHREITTH